MEKTLLEGKEKKHSPLCKGQVKLKRKVHISIYKELPQRQVTALGKIIAKIFIFLAKHIHQSDELVR